MREQSVFVIKPDGVRSGLIRPLLLRHLEDHSMSVVKEHEFACDADRVLNVWPMFGLRGHRVMREMYFRYMNSGPCVAILVEGPSAVSVCRQIKKELRKEFEVCAFENAIHAPEDEAERIANVSLLFGDRSEIIPERAWPGWTKRGQFGRAADISDQDVSELADRIWADRLLGEWSDVFVSAPKAGTHMLVLRPGDPNSIDFGLSALLEMDKDRSLENAVRLYIESEVAGGAVIASGDMEEVERSREFLEGLKMKVDVILAGESAWTRPVTSAAGYQGVSAHD